MTISVKCECGKQLAAPDSLRGKKARCPSCGKPVLVRDELDATPPEPPESREFVPPPPAAKEQGPQEDDYDLALDKDELAAAVSPGGESGEESGDGLRRCPNCKIEMADGQIVCPACGFNPQASVFAGQKRTQDTTKVYGHVLGIDMTLARWITLAAAVVVIAGAVGWYYTMGPGRKFRVLGTQVVTGFNALDTISVLEPLSLGHLGGDARLGMKAPAGLKVPGVANAQNANPETGEEQDITGLGGGDKLTLTRPDPTGNYLLIRAEISQSFLKSLGFSSGYDVVFKAGAYTLDTSAGSAPGILLAAEVPSGGKINISEGRVSDYKALYPAIYKPSHEDLKFESNFPDAGEVAFDGGGAKGSFHFDAPGMRQPGSSSLVATGRLDVTSPQGMSVAYDYKGGGMTVGWAPDVTGWRASAQYVKPEHFSPFHKWAITLLFPRPAGVDTGRIMLNGNVLATISIPAGSASSAAMPGITVTAPPPPPESAQAGGSGSTGGSSKPSSPVASSDPLSSYLSALARARQKAKGIVSASNMQQVLYAIMLYAEQHGGKMPDKLDDLRGTIDDFDQIMRNPRTQESPGFIYVKPADNYSQIKDPGYTQMLYESDNGQKDPKGDIGYADGHVTMGM